jgi:hypothetical protein
MKVAAKILSYIFHPIWMPFAISMLLIYACPAEWVCKPKELLLWKIQIAVNTIGFPLFVIALMKGLGFIENFQMRETKERLAPMMAIMLFNFWNFYVFHRLTNSPEIFRTFLLSTFIAISLLFFATIFVKVSMHMAGIAGAFTILVAQVIRADCMPTAMPCVALVAVVLVAWARLYLKEHTKAEIVLGAGIGVLSVLVCLWLY